MAKSPDAALLGALCLGLLAPAAHATEVLSTMETAGARISYSRSEVRLSAAGVDVRRFSGQTPAYTVSADGLRGLVEPGQPELAGRMILVAVPPDAAVTLEWLSAESHDQSDVWIAPAATTPVRSGDEEADAVEFKRVPDPELYATDQFWPNQPVSIVSRGIARDVEYLVVQVIPFQWNPVRRVLRTYDNLDVRLRFGEPAAAPASPHAGSQTAVPVAQAASDSVAGMRNRGERDARGRDAGDPLVVDTRIPPEWRMRRKALELPRILQSLNPAATGEAWKIEIDTDGLYRVTFAELASAGFPAAVSANQLKLELNGRPVAIRVLDANTNLQFDAGDDILFYGLANPERFSATHVYWLTRGGGGLFVKDEPALPDGWKSLPNLPSWPATQRVEKNERYQEASPVDPAVGDPWVFNETIRTNANCALCLVPPCDFTETLTLPPQATPEVGRIYSIRGRMLAGGLQGACLFDQQAVTVKLGAQVVGTVQWLVGAGPWVEWSFPISPATLAAPPASNSITLDTDTTLAPGPHKTWIDYVEIDSPARFLAGGDRMDAAGDWSKGGVIHAAGFVNSDIEIFDIRGDGTVARLVGPRILSLGAGQPRTVVFALPVSSGLPGAERHRIAAYSRSQLRSARAVRKDTPSNLGVNRDLAHLVIAHPDLLAASAQLAAHRTSTGVKSAAFDVTDIYDEFSWGNVDPQAIRDFIAHAWSTWSVPPLYALLVGDSSYDFRNNFNLSMPGYPPAAWVPHREYMTAVRNNLTQILGSDFFFQELTGDDFPDLLVGRIAARSASEVDNYRLKLQGYEARSGQDAWNGRYVMVSDDDVSSSHACTSPVNQPALGEVELFFRGLVSTYLAAAGSDAVLIEERDYYQTNAAGRQVIIDQRNLGESLFIYFGHGSIVTCGTNVCSGNYFWQDSDLPWVTNATALPFSAAVSCNIGAFHITSAAGVGVRSYGEAFTLNGPRGDIAFLGSTTVLSPAGGKGQLEAMFDALFAPASAYLPPFLPAADASRRAGGIHYAGQLGFLLNPNVGLAFNKDNQRTLVLHGDPAVKLLIQNP